MNRIEQFNHDINQSDLNRYENWKVYRNQVSHLFNDATKTLSKEQDSCLVLGAGNCDDIDLINLKTRFKKIALSDIDISSMKQGITRQGLKLDDFTLVQADFTGFEQILFFENLIDDLLIMKTSHEIESYLNDKIQSALLNSFTKNFSKLFNVIMVTPIYTQLIYHQTLKISEVLKEMNYDGKLISIFEDTVLDFMPSIIDRFNQNVVSLLDKNGLIIILSDIFQSQKGDDFDKKVSKSIQSKKAMNLLYHKYNETYGYGLGDFGLLSMTNMMKELKHEWLLWPFDQKTNMTIKLVIYTK